MKRRTSDRAPDIVPAGLAAHGDKPLYRQVYETLREAIARGEWPEHSAMPTEGELGLRFGVSRITVRHALQLLEFEGFIRKQKARNAIVLTRQPQGRFGWQIDSIDDIIAATRDATLKLLSYREETSAAAAELLDVPADTRLHCLRSLLQRGGKTFARSIIYFHPRIGSRLKREDFDDVIVFRVMQRELNVRLRDVKHTIRAELANADDAQNLDVAERDPILSTQLVYRSDQGDVVEVAFTRYPARQYTLTYSLTTPAQRA